MSYKFISSIIKTATYIFVFAIFPVLLFGQNDTSNKKVNPINDDTYLHPIDANTPYTLKKGE